MNQVNQTKEWSNPTPAGLVALAVACFCFFALLTGRVTGNAIPLLGIWLLGGFVVQFVVAIVDLKGGNTTGGNTFLFFSAFFMLVGGLGMLFKFQMASNNIVLDARIDGWAWLVLSTALVLWTPAFLKTPLVLSLMVIVLNIALPLITLIDLEILSAEFSFIPGWALLIVGMLGIYLSAAIIVNGAFGREVYPNPGPILSGEKKSATVTIPNNEKMAKSPVA
ncbi:acetate uptake transporter family protein [Alkaliphilus metalliredigens]|uniref:acetate uptake transporter family protein n=1 Tax=Alkaliphilus metalliredigens TaxID=208226 RepID=UPI0012EEB9F3|nr:GPR1/FUN34/YaaH family transporter [Alkaliphilus metalliredigens]